MSKYAEDMHLQLASRLTHFSMTSTTSLPFRVGWSILPSALLIHSFMGTSRWKPITKMPPLCEPWRAIRTHVARCCSSKLHLKCHAAMRVHACAVRVHAFCCLACAAVHGSAACTYSCSYQGVVVTSKPVNNNLLASKQSLCALKLTSLSVTHDVLQVISYHLILTFDCCVLQSWVIVSEA